MVLGKAAPIGILNSIKKQGRQHYPSFSEYLLCGDRANFILKEDEPETEELFQFLDDLLVKLDSGLKTKHVRRKASILISDAFTKTRQLLHSDYAPPVVMQGMKNCRTHSYSIIVATRRTKMYVIQNSQGRKGPFALSELTEVVLEAGDVLVFDGYLVHAGAEFIGCKDVVDFRLHCYAPVVIHGRCLDGDKVLENKVAPVKAM